MTDRLTREQVDAFLARHKDPEDARRFLQEAGLIDENGELAKPYRLEPDLTPLSPAAQAVLDAPMAYSGPAFETLVRKMTSATLRAATEQIDNLYYADLVIDDSDGAVFVLRQLMLIADELEEVKYGTYRCEAPWLDCMDGFKYSESTND